MITGFVTPEREAVIRFSIRDRNAGEREIQGVIDTGFNGYLTLPENTIESLGLSYHSRTIATLADGSDRVLRQYLATVIWGDRERDAIVLSAEGDPLIPMAMLYGYDVFLRVVNGGIVTIRTTSL